MTAALAHRTTRRATAALLACGFVLYAVQVFAHHPFGDTVDTALYDGLLVAGALICLARVVANPADRLAWGLVGGGLLAWAAADIYNTLVLAKLDDPPYPSISDAGWLVYYPTSYVAALLLARRRGTRVPTGTWLDGVIAALACAALASALLFEPILSAAIDGATAAIVTNLAYPVGDLLLVLLVVAVLGLTGWRPGRMWIVFAAGLVVSAIADSWYLADTAKGTYAEGGVLDILWPLSALLLGWAAWQPRRARDLRLEGARVVVVPVAASLTALALTFYDHFSQLNVVAISLATATLVVAAVRMGLAFVVNARVLARSRHEAVTDALTGLRNRRALMDDLEVSMRGEDTLVLFDLDGFKRYNDTFGHPAGDGLLQRLGGRLAQAVDGHGHAYRMGGDEFCVLLHDRADGVVAAATRALSESGRGFAIGASHGIVVPAVEATTAAEALQIADQRMYEHKAQRRASGAQLEPVETFIAAVASPLGTDEEQRGEGSADERLRAAARAGRPAGPGATPR